MLGSYEGSELSTVPHMLCKIDYTNNKRVHYSANVITKLSAYELMQGNNREKSGHIEEFLL